MNNKKKIAFLHRYGLEGWICCGGHAVPSMVDQLSASAEVHFIGPETTEQRNDILRGKLTMHLLPWEFDRSNSGHKWSKTLRFYCALPRIGRRCKKLGIDFIYWEETLPLGTRILQLFYGPNVGVMVMDFFARIYTEKKPWLHGLRNLVEWLDCQSWKKLPAVYTHVRVAKDFLIERGVPADRIHVVPNPCDHTIFHPVDDATRAATRKKLGFTNADIVLSHHGILHPNKGNDWILHRIAELKEELPNLKYLLIGNGSEMAPLQKLASTLRIADRIVFTGWLPSEKEMNEALASADVGLVMRIGQETDHFHMTDTLNHEMACRKPILAVRLKGIAEIIQDGENGFLFSPAHPAEFREALLRLATQPDTREKFGEKALRCSHEVSDLKVFARHVVDPIKTIVFET
ncbi:MAG: glycosyltransferase [Kiritimatiellales bacterium]|nr:glycosyltransferase [Kiritimatiellales bacterium]